MQISAAMLIRNRWRMPYLVSTAILSLSACREAASPTVLSPPLPNSILITSDSNIAGASSSPTADSPSKSLPVAINAGACPRVALLDDLEDADGTIQTVEQRSGQWSSYTDKLGSSITPAPDAAFETEISDPESSNRAVHFRGKTSLGNVYAGVGFWFTAEKLPYDASCCKGIAFRAKRAKESIDSVRLKVGDTNTLPEGQVCKNCFNDFGVDLGFGLEWKQYRIPFDNMRQSPNWGDQFPRISPARLLQIQWQISHPGFDFDVWIDDVSLYDCAPPN